MADKLTPDDKQMMITSFLEIAVGQTSSTAHQFLEATSWKLDEAIQLFYVGNEGGFGANSSSYLPHVESNAPSSYQNSSVGQGNGDEVRAPLPVRTESLYGRSSRHGYAPTYDEEMMEPEVWGEEQAGTSMTDNSQDSLASLYRPPYALMYLGSFEQAKVAAAGEDKWLIVNLQSEKEFNSHMLNRDTWANEVVAQTIKSSFVFWQMYNGKTEGMKVCTYYKVDSLPAILIIDPITGQRMRSWSGMLHPDQLLEALIPLMDKGPRMYIHKLYKKASTSVVPVSKDEAIDAPMEGVIEAEDKPGASTDAEAGVSSPEKRSYPPLPDEPKGEKSLLCRVAFRLPDGRRVQRNFLRSDPIQLLWSFCYNQLGEDKERGFQLVEAMPGSSKKVVDYDNKVAVGESGLSNSMISVRWE